mmetsp:Transcript_799/g.2347  ORF Transcript_799/g.2347 Transcript_799/m.2347 type:complete len:612 (-) Transcript_799:13-1848(-)
MARSAWLAATLSLALASWSRPVSLRLRARRCERWRVSARWEAWRGERSTWARVSSRRPVCARLTTAGPSFVLESRWRRLRTEHEERSSASATASAPGAAILLEARLSSVREVLSARAAARAAAPASATRLPSAWRTWRRQVGAASAAASALAPRTAESGLRPQESWVRAVVGLWRARARASMPSGPTWLSATSRRRSDEFSARPLESWTTPTSLRRLPQSERRSRDWLCRSASRRAAAAPGPTSFFQRSRSMSVLLSSSAPARRAAPASPNQFHRKFSVVTTHCFDWRSSAGRPAPPQPMRFPPRRSFSTGRLAASTAPASSTASLSLRLQCDRFTSPSTSSSSSGTAPPSAAIARRSADWPGRASGPPGAGELSLLARHMSSHVLTSENTAFQTHPVARGGALSLMFEHDSGPRVHSADGACLSISASSSSTSSTVAVAGVASSASRSTSTLHACLCFPFSFVISFWSPAIVSACRRSSARTTSTSDGSGTSSDSSRSLLRLHSRRRSSLPSRSFTRHSSPFSPCSSDSLSFSAPRRREARYRSTSSPSSPSGSPSDDPLRSSPSDDELLRGVGAFGLDDTSSIASSTIISLTAAAAALSGDAPHSCKRG